MNCSYCHQPAPDNFEHVVEAGWIPSYYAGQQEMQGPICPECCGKYLRLGDDGEWEAKVPPAIAHRYS